MDTKRNQEVIVAANLAFAGSTKSNTKYLVDKNR